MGVTVIRPPDRPSLESTDASVEKPQAEGSLAPEPSVSSSSAPVRDHAPSSGPIPPSDSSEGLLNRVTLAVTSSLDTDEVLERLASLALEACPAHRCSIFLLDDSGTKLIPRTYVAHPKISDEIACIDYQTRAHFRDMTPVDLKADPSRWGVFRLGKAFTIADVANSPLVPPEATANFRTRSAIIVPLIAPEEPIGLLALDWLVQREEFPESELVLVEAIGGYASLAIRNARLFEKLNEKARSLERLAKIASALNSTLSLRDVQDLAAANFAELLGSDYCSINMLVDGPDAMRLGMLWTDSVDPVVREARPDEDDLVFSMCPPSARSAAAFPLLRGDEVAGFVIVAFPDPGTLAANKLELGSALAGLVASAVERAELYESHQTQLQQMVVLYGLSDAVARTSNPSGALRQLNHLLGSDIGLELESISVANDRLRGVLDADPPDEAESEAIRSWRATLATSRGRLHPRVNKDAVLVPIIHRGRVQGVLKVRLSGRLLDAATEELLHALASACAEVIHKAGLTRDLAEREQRLAVAAEREGIAQGLHDSVGQLITELGMQLATYAGDAPDEEWRKRFQELIDLTATGSRQMREAIHSLLFFQVRHRGLVRSLRELAQTFEATSGVTTSFQVRGRPTTLEVAREDALFRVAHEALTNVQRHSGAASVLMTLTYESHEVVLAVRDDGLGLGRKDPLRQRRGHFGLHGIQRRLEETGGELLVASARPRGVLIEARIGLRRRRKHAAGARRRH